jgi:hypothetical protein
MLCEGGRDGVCGDFVDDVGEINASPPPPLANENPDFDGVVTDVEIGFGFGVVVARVSISDSLVLFDGLKNEATNEGDTLHVPCDKRAACFDGVVFPGENVTLLGVMPPTAIFTEHTVDATTVSDSRARSNTESPLITSIR